MMSTTHTPLNSSPVLEPTAKPDWGTIRRVFQRFTTSANAVDILRSCVSDLSTGPFEIQDCVILDAKLKTYLKPASKHKSTLSACYRLTLREGVTGSTSHRILYAKAFLGGQSRETFQRLTQSGMSDPDFQDAVRFVPEHDLILWKFPHDPALPLLRYVVDLPTVEHYLPMDGLRQIGLQGTPRVLMRHLVNYRPEIRCTNRYTLYDTTQGRTDELFGKTFGDSQGRSLHEHLQFFWDRSLADPEAMAVAQPLGYSAAINTVWQRGVPGKPLFHLFNRSNYKHYIAAVAKGLASLHTSPVTGLATHLLADHFAEIRKKLTKLSDAFPSCSDILKTIAHDIEQTAPAPSTIPFCPIHWDFHIDQLLADQGKLVFCDLDELIVGDPIQDLANFIVDLRLRLADPEFIRLIATELCHHYQKLVPWEVSAERLAWHIRLQLVNKAYRHYLRFSPGFEDVVEDVMRMTQRGLPL